MDLSVSHGVLSAVASGSASVTGQYTDSLTITGTLDDLNATIASVSYTPATDYIGQDSLDILVDDLGNSGAGGALTDDASVSIDVLDNLLWGWSWIDFNQDGLQDDNEFGLEGVGISLYHDDDTLYDSTTTDDSGYYAFSNLPVGDYYLVFDPPAGYTFSPQDEGSDDSVDSDADSGGATSDFSVGIGDVLEFDAGASGSGDVIGLLWDDTNEDGIQDQGEDGIEGVTVELYDVDAELVDSVTTDSAGGYIFSAVPSGKYLVRFGKPAGYAFSPPGEESDADAGGQTPLFLLLNENHDLDAGAYLASGSVTGAVWEDDDYDGIRGASEPRLEGVTVGLYTGGILVDTTSTDSNGAYAFANVGWGDYYVEVVPPTADHIFAPQDAGSDDDVDSDVGAFGVSEAITLSSGGQTAAVLDAGLFDSDPPTGSVAGWVWLDANDNDVQDSGEEGIAGVEVELYLNDDTFVTSAVTDGAGDYQFTAAPGSYYIKVNAPANHAFATPGQGSDPEADSDVDGAGLSADFDIEADETTAVDAGMQAATGAIGGSVWLDIDDDGVRETGEGGLKGITVELYESDDTFVADVETNNNGGYQFVELTPGDYYVKFILPVDFDFAPDGVDSHADEFGIADVSLAAGTTEERDAGMHGPYALVLIAVNQTETHDEKKV